MGVTNRKYRLHMLEITTASRFLDPSSMKKLIPVSSRANNMPFNKVFRLIVVTCFIRNNERSRSPITFVMQTKANVGISSGTFCKNTYCIADKTVIKISPANPILSCFFSIFTPSTAASL